VWDRIAQSCGRVAGPFAALLHSPEMARRIAETGHYVRFEGPLSQAERELAIITVARLLDAQAAGALRPRGGGRPERDHRVLRDDRLRAQRVRHRADRGRAAVARLNA
jgi:hypothetical protein